MGTPVEGPRVRRARNRRALAVVALVAVVVALAVVIVDAVRGDAYRVHARFANAGQLVTGARVEVAGTQIGSVSAIKLTDDGLADVEMRITDDRFAPFRRGTRVSIRAVGQATLTNRYVDVGIAGPDEPELPDGAVLAREDVNGIVDLDAILNSVDAPMRRSMQRFFGSAAQVVAGSGAPELNAMLAELDPAMGRIGDLMADLAGDRDALEDVLETGARTVRTLASRTAELETAVTGSARTFQAVADRSASLEAILRDAPAVLRQAGATLSRGGRAARTLRPALRAIPPSQPRLRKTLDRVATALPRLDPAIRELGDVLPDADVALRSLERIGPQVVDAVPALSKGAAAALPMLEGLRFYGADLLLGVVKGLAGVSSGGHNATGHYVKLEFVQNPQTLVGGAFSGAIPGLTKDGVAPGIINVGMNQRARCPGGNAPPAPDGSNPWYPKAGICDPSQSMSPGVNSPTAFCHTFTNCEGQPPWPEPDVPAALPEFRDDEGGDE
ncbi:MAG: MlaD family protein [Solirubrobacteraceae bacterium]|nr:MlaD family protein [Solirubrobacteraceae bacterium]